MSKSKKKIRFIINPTSGIGKQRIVENRIDAYLDKSQFDYEICYTTSKNHATELSQQAAELHYDAVIAVGGDGTLNEVAQGLVYTTTAMGIIPAGSGNGFARFMKIPLNIRKALKVINRFRIKAIDTGQINNRLFVSITGVGYDAHVAERFAKSKNRGFWSYAKIVFLEYIKYNPKRFKIYINNRILKTNSFMISIANSDQFGFNARISPNAKIDDGLFDVCIVRKPRIYYVLFLLPFFFIRLIHRTPFVRIIRTTNVKIVQLNNNVAHIDGDDINLGRCIEAKINPGSLQLVY
ncbi:MAG: diacylglycerol kinase family protein [Bacteroidota bacterium]